MNIAYAFTSNWFYYFLISSFSLISNNKEEEIDFYLLVNEIEDKCLKITKIIQLHFPMTRFHFIEVNESIFNEKSDTVLFTKTALYRLLLPNLLLEEKVLYLDVDTIIQGSLRELYDTKLDNNLIAGVIDLDVPYYIKMEIQLGFEDPYFNSGVLLMNLKGLYSEGFVERMIELANTSNFIYPDQSILNKICKGRTKILDKKFNYALNITVKDENKNDVARAIIIHYASYKTNWVYELPYADIYRKWEEKWNDFEVENNLYLI